MSDSVFDLWPAFVAGFKASGEGFNGEWPFADKDLDPAKDQVVRQAFAEWVKAL